jgi:hypothetical protein
MSDRATRTFQTRISDRSKEPMLSYSSLMAHVEHCLFADIAAGKIATDLKSSYLTSFRITARQFNAVRVRLEGKIDSILQLLSQRIETKKHQIESLEKAISNLKNKKTLHEKKRRLAKLTSHLCKLEIAKKDKKVPLCFGSKKLFRAQFNRELNGYATHEAWQKDWRETRTSEVFILGSKDETSGNQSCTAAIAEDGSIDLRIRMPDALIPQFGKYLRIPQIRFTYGHDEIVAAIRDCSLRQQLHRLNDPSYKNHGRAISYRFKVDAKGWRVFVSTDIQLAPLVTRKHIGVIAVDINSDHLAVMETDRFGNPLQTFHIPLQLHPPPPIF